MLISLSIASNLPIRIKGKLLNMSLFNGVSFQSILVSLIESIYPNKILGFQSNIPIFYVQIKIINHACDLILYQKWQPWWGRKRSSGREEDWCFNEREGGGELSNVNLLLKKKKKFCLSHALHTTDMSMEVMAIQYNIKLYACLIQLIWTKMIDWKLSHFRRIKLTQFRI